MIRRTLFSVFLTIIAVAGTAFGRTPEAASAAFSSDTLTDYRFSPRQLILPGALVAVGSFGAANGWFRAHVDRNVDHALGSHREWRIGDYVEFVPLAASIATGFADKGCRYTFADRSLAAVTSFVLLEAVTQPLKRVVRRMRPDMSDRHSFPSGHTATAFAGAELCRIEYGATIGAAAYVVAGGTAAMRMAGRHHWLSDCIAAAGIGILSARAAMWLLPFERRILTRIFHRNSALALIPAVSPAGGRGATLGLTAVIPL